MPERIPQEIGPSMDFGPNLKLHINWTLPQFKVSRKPLQLRGPGPELYSQASCTFQLQQGRRN